MQHACTQRASWGLAPTLWALHAMSGGPSTLGEEGAAPAAAPVRGTPVAAESSAFGMFSARPPAWVPVGPGVRVHLPPFPSPFPVGAVKRDKTPSTKPKKEQYPGGFRGSNSAKSKAHP